MKSTRTSLSSRSIIGAGRLLARCIYVAPGWKVDIYSITDLGGEK